MVRKVDDPQDKSDEIYRAIQAEFATLPTEAREALAQAAMSGIADGILQMEVVDGATIAGVNRLAAEYASKHALEKWFPDIPEPMRTKIRQIIKNAFEEKTPFSELIEEIREAGILSGEHPRLMPTDLRKPECPYCQNALL